MCRGFQQQSNRERQLKIKAFYLRLCLPNFVGILPDSLTLHYLPRINGSPLEIDQLSIRPDSPGFVTLYRVVASEKGSVFYGSRERVGVSEGVKFEVYLREEKVVRGVFRKDEEGEWKLELKCGIVEIKEVEVIVAAEGSVGMKEKVEMGVMRKRRGRCFQVLEEIPEEREGELVEEEGGGCCCCECGMEEGGGEGVVEVEMEGVRWALDIGIWVACLSVGCLLSIAASSRKAKRNFMK